jgi:uncharacterized repeat protein (TIGR03803 family)
MAHPEQTQTFNFRIHLDTAAAAVLTIAFALVLSTAPPAVGQTYTVLHTFTSKLDGGIPYAGLTMDAAGNLYGAAARGGYAGVGCFLGLGCGAVFKMSKKGSGWVFTPLYDFKGLADGSRPEARVVFAPDGSLYGTTLDGGKNSNCGYWGCGTVYKLTPPPSACQSAICPWTHTVIYSFHGGSDGENPFSGIVFDKAGNLYGTTSGGGASGQGTVYELTPSNGGWTESILYSFTGGADGGAPIGTPILDASGNLYGTTVQGGISFYGVVFELSPSGSGWTETVLHRFNYHVDGDTPEGGLIFDPSGNLYGTTSDGGPNNAGTVFMLTPSNGSWNLTTLYAFSGNGGTGPTDTLLRDAAGNLYGTTGGLGGSPGFVFELKSSGGGGWTYVVLHSFHYDDGGCVPWAGVISDAGGNLYGTNTENGADFAGTVYELTP